MDKACKNDGAIPLGIAAVHGQAKVVKALIKAGCGLNNVGLQDGSALLLMAAHMQQRTKLPRSNSLTLRASPIYSTLL